MNKDFWKGKRVLITGHTGFKGGWLSLILKNFQAEVFGFSLSPNTMPNFFDACSLSSVLNHEIGDIRDFDFFKNYLFSCKPDIVIHMAAQPLVRYSYKNPIETYSTNVMGTVNVLEAVRLLGSVGATIVVTTDKCYENKEHIWSYRENDRLGGYDPYSNSKACAELVTKAYAQSYFIDGNIGAIASVRAGNVVGGGDWSTDRLIPDVITKIFRDESPIIRNPQSIRPWQHVLEPLYGYMLTAEKIYSKNQKELFSWNFGPYDLKDISVGEVIDLVYKYWPSDFKPMYENADKLHEAGLLKLDSTKARGELSWNPKLSIDETIEWTVGWYKEYYSNPSNGLNITNKQINKYFSI